MKAVARKSEPPKARLVGKTTIEDLSSVTKNSWNPNRMTPFERQSLRHGLVQDGWLVSHALTVWRTDEKGKTRNIIIDGEHRWEEAIALGMKQGPMVFLDGLTEAAAKMLTVKLDAKRGRFDEDALASLLKGVQESLNLETQALDLGIQPDLLSDYLRPDVVAPPVAEIPSGQTAAVKTVPLYFQPADHEAFTKLVRELSEKYKTKNSTDTVFEAVRRAHAAATTK